MLILSGIGVIALVGGAAWLKSLPNVDDAEGRVRATLGASGGTDTNEASLGKVAQAIVAIEDRRFYDHPGIDPISLGRDALTVITGGQAGGAATITQQLAKALYVRTDQSLAAELSIAGVAIKLEQRYTKAQLLEMYLNAIYYGHSYWGIWQASEGYFGKAPNELDWAEASLLAGLPRAPTTYDPAVHFDLARERQIVVLRALVEVRALNNAQASAAHSELTALDR